MQVGQDIDSESDGDRAGGAVAISADGNTIIVGAINNEDNGRNSGHARVFRLNDSTWTQIGQDINGEVEDGFGRQVAISADGNTIVISASGPVGDGAQHARVFRLNDSTWTQIGQDINGDLVEFRGDAVAISGDGNTIITGDNRTHVNGTDSGVARVFRLEDNTWGQLGQNIYGETEFDNLGTAVAISDDGDAVIVGSPGHGIERGSARIYQLTGNDWQQVGNTIDGEAPGDGAARAVAMSADGRSVAIGSASNIGENRSASGHARIYQRAGQTWVQVGQDIDGEAEFDRSGSAVGISADGSTVVVGAFLNDGPDPFTLDNGHARVYRLFDPPNAPACTAQDLGNGNITLTWDPFNGEDDNYQVRLNGSWQAAIPATETLTYTGPADGNYLIRSRESTAEDLPCSSGNNTPPPPPPSTCNGLVATVDIGAGDVPTAGDDVILGTDGADIILAGGGNDTIFGVDGADVVNGGAGDDIIDGEDGDDDLRGQGGDDTLNGGDGIDQFFGGSGADTITTGNGGNAGTAQVVQGQGGPDIITGSSEDLSLIHI